MVKNQRVVAPKKSATNIITTSSWRVGQNIQRKYKKEISLQKSGKSQLKRDEVSTTQPSEQITSTIDTGIT